MKKLALALGLFIFSLESKAQFAYLDSSEIKELEKAPIEVKYSFPNLIIEDKRSFDSIRNQIHISGIKYKFIEFDSLEITSRVTIFDEDGMGLPRIGIEELGEKQITLVDKEGRFVRMIYLDPKI